MVNNPPSLCDDFRILQSAPVNYHCDQTDIKRALHSNRPTIVLFFITKEGHYTNCLISLKEHPVSPRTIPFPQPQPKSEENRARKYHLKLQKSLRNSFFSCLIFYNNLFLKKIRRATLSAFKIKKSPKAASKNSSTIAFIHSKPRSRVLFQN